MAGSIPAAGRAARPEHEPSLARRARASHHPPMTRTERLASWLGARRPERLAPLAAALVALPTARLGYMVDDHWHRALLEGKGRFAALACGPLNAFDFYDGTDARARVLVESGVSPWWAFEKMRLSLFRPLSSALHALDHLVLRSAVASHLLSIAVYALAAWIAALAYRRLFAEGGRAGAPRAPWVATFAALVWALDHDHGMSVGWIAGRNAVLSGVFGLLAIHLALARTATGAALSALAFAGGLAAGEGGVGALGYVAAIELWLASDGWRARAARLAPHGLVLVGWAVLRRRLGYGAYGSGMYTDPLADPAAFARRTVEELPALLGSELGLPGLDAWGVLPRPAQLGMVAVSALLLALVGRAAVAARADRRVAVLSAGAVLAAIPACATLPSTRALVLPSFGAMGVLALLFDDARSSDAGGGAPLRAGRRFVWLLGWAHVVVSPLLFQVVAQGMTTYEAQARRFADSLPSDPAAQVLVMSVPEPTFTSYALVIRDVRGDVGPGAAFTIASGLYASEVTRESDRVLRVRQPDGFYRRGAMDTLARDPDFPMRVGERIALADVTVEVREVSPSGVPVEIRVELGGALERYRFVWWEGDRFAPFELPAVGGTRRVEPRSFFETL